MSGDQTEFRARITFRRAQYMDDWDDWHVEVERLSDGKKIVRVFAWCFPRWRAERWARSTKRLRRWFARQDAWDAETNTTFEVQA